MKRNGTAPVLFTDGSWAETGTTGYVVTWKKGETWKGVKAHMGWGQEAYDAECAAIVRALRTAATKNQTLGSVTFTVFTGHLEDVIGRLGTR